MATTRKIAGPGKLGSISAAKKSLKGGGNRIVKTIPENDSITVRFLEEPDQFYGFYEWYNAEEKTFYPVVDGEELPDGVRASFRYLANGYVVDDSAVRAVKMPKSLFEQIMARYEKHGTILDRDYELTRSGSGLDTTYMLTPEAPSKMNLKRFELLDLEAILAKMLEDEDDDADDEPVKKTVGKTAPRQTVVDDDDEDDEDEDEDEAPVRRPVKRVAKKTVARRTAR